MDKVRLYEKIEEKIAECKKNYEKEKDDSFMSFVRNSEIETLQFLYDHIRKEEPTDKLSAELRERLLELEKAKECELEHPTFDWYDEHYHYKILEGQCDAYKSVIKLLDIEVNE